MAASSDEEDYEVYSISKPDDGNDLSPSRRSTQRSHFGSVDEDVRLQFDRTENDDDDDDDEDGYGRTESSRGAAEGGYQAGARPAHHGNDPRRIPSEEFQEGGGEDVSSSQLAEVADRLISEAGYRECACGIKDVKFIVVVGLGFVYAGIQLVFMTLLVPDVARDLCLDDTDTGWLRVAVLIGVAKGALLHGCISDLTSRRTCLMASLLTAGVFGVIVAVVTRTHEGLLICLGINGWGIGGILSTALPYYAELLPRKDFEKHIPTLFMFLLSGSGFMSLIASEFTNITPELCNGYCFASWRVAGVALSFLPILSALMIYMLHLPESPRLLMEHNEWTKAIAVLSQIYENTHGCDDSEAFKYKANELYRIGRQRKRSKSSIPAPKTRLQSIVAAVTKFFKNIGAVLTNPIGKYTDRLVICGIAFAFGYCGWALWLPDYIKAAGIKDHRVDATIISHTTLSNTNYTAITIENTQYHNVTLRNIQYLNTYLNDVHFVNSILENCRFEQIVSESVKFTHCKVISTVFETTDIRANHFYDSEWENSTFGSQSGACSSEEPFAPTVIYYEICVTHIAGMMGAFAASFGMKFIGSQYIFIFSSVASAIVVFTVLVLSSALSGMAVFLSLQFTGIAGWCALCVHCMLLYPTGKRGTALGLLITISSLCGLMGLGIVAELPIKTTQVAQTIVTSLLLVASGVFMWTIPSVKDEPIN